MANRDMTRLGSRARTHDSLVSRMQHGGGKRKEHFTGVGESAALWGAVDQARAHLLFEAADLATQ